MDLTECVLTRKAIRAYKPTPVSKELLARILTEATRSSSSANTQPWGFAVFGGKVMEEMRKAYRENFLSGVQPNPDIAYDPTAWPEPYRTRREENTKRLHEAIGIQRENEEQRKQYTLRGYTFFGAPNGIILYIDDVLLSPVLPWSTLDIGGVLQTILLLAHNYELGCCVQGQMIFYPDVIRRLMDIPTSKKIVIGVSIGYPDMDDIINQQRTERLPLDEVASWYGF